jgi:hypothetical protein
VFDRQDLTFGVTGQTLYLDVPEGRPSSVTSMAVRRWDESDDASARSATTGSTSIDSVSTTFDAASGASQANPKIARLTATTGIAADRIYLATDAQGRREWIHVVGIAAGDYVAALLPLGLDYVAADTFVGTRISISVDSTWIADRGNLNVSAYPWDQWRLRCEYVVGGVTYVRNKMFSVVRTAGKHTVTPADVDVRFPGVLKLLATDYREQRAQLLVDRAYDEVATDLLQVDVPDEAVAMQKVVNELTVLKTVVLWAQARALAGGDPASVELSERVYRERFQALFGAASRSKVPGTSETGAGAPRAPQALTVR